MQFSVPSFIAGLAAGIVLTFAVLNGGACRPSPTPTDEGTPVKVEVPKVEIAAPVPAPAVPAVEVKAVAPVAAAVPVADAKVEDKGAPISIEVTGAPVPE